MADPRALFCACCNRSWALGPCWACSSDEEAVAAGGFGGGSGGGGGGNTTAKRRERRRQRRAAEVAQELEEEQLLREAIERAAGEREAEEAERAAAEVDAALVRAARLHRSRRPTKKVSAGKMMDMMHLSDDQFQLSFAMFLASESTHFFYARGYLFSKQDGKVTGYPMSREEAVAMFEAAGVDSVSMGTAVKEYLANPCAVVLE